MAEQRPPHIDFGWIDSQDGLVELVDELLEMPRYALDTEFHRERTYFPKLALIQIAWWPEGTNDKQELVLIDPLELDVSEFGRLFDTDSLCVIHAAQQDLDVLTHAVGSVPNRMFDTQIAGGFVGYGTPSLVSLLQGEVGITPAKGDRLTDWLHRPLTDNQCQYAAADVEYLLDVHDRLVAKLEEMGRLGWAEEACEELRTRPVSGANPSDSWLRLKDARSLRPKGRAIAQSLAAWREERAMRVDIPVRQVLPDLAILGASQRGPSTLKELRQARGIDDRHTKGGIAQEILDAVERGKNAPPPDAPKSTDDLDRNLRPAITLISAWVSQMARDEKIDTTMLATRADIVSLLRDDDDARLASGWREELLGQGIRDLVSGKAGLTFDPQGRLTLMPV
ncbi:ribonuclease D [Ilumatobacter nonamiensis]|uniref:ribonuclease D n=1 Tax=Ilumatobacter nonamiensis TaxID=467093 RepID=UPI000346B29C|nr:HRDC domain-containing protein [Ilumatobacter nonamiensis]